MRQFEYDCYSSIARVFDRDRALVMVDVGANEGLTVRRMLGEFPHAQVHAFEPAPETYQLLLRGVHGLPGVRTYPLACGSSCGSADFHVTDNHWCSSLLKPSALGKTYYGQWYQTREVVKVPVVTLDAWAHEHGIAHADFIKVDAQGFDLEVLKGASNLLQTASAVNCECQFAPEYEGCATFSQIDQFLTSRGFMLHQIHDLVVKGNEQQTSYADALWLRADVLAALRARKDLPDLSPAGRIGDALRRARANGRRRAALYGAGSHTRRAIQRLDGAPLPIAAILDDRAAAAGATLGTLPIISPSAARAAGIDVVVLSSDAHEAALWESSASLRAAGIEVIPLYARYASADQPAATHAA